MKKFILEVEHQYKNKFVGRYRFSSKSGTVVLGQSSSSDIRLLGEDVSPIHTLIEHTGDEWYVIDAGSTSGTWLKKQPITSETFSDTTQVQIGGHTLTLVPKTIENQALFVDSNPEEVKGQLLFHQVVTVKSGMLIATQLLPATEPYKFHVQGKEVELPAPKNKEWTEVTYGPITVKQRLTRSDDISLTWGDRFKALAAPEMRTPLMMVFVFIFIVAGLIIAVPHAPESEMMEVRKDNTFTRMIYDSKVLKEKREEAQERKVALKKAAAQTGGGAGAGQETNTTPIQSKGGTPKSVSKIKGLSAMLGKISARASSKSLQIVSQGRAPNEGASGKVNLASVGSLQGIATQVGNGGEVFRVGGVGTVGKGGGAKGSLGALGALSGGNAGNASVGVLEEETEIEGGLDRDVIARIIQNQLGEIRYCYERQLSAEPDLYGKVQVKFTINETGTVLEQRVGLTTLKNAMVEGCILRRMTRWKFPKPKGGTHVLVTYPFMFKATN